MNPAPVALFVYNRPQHAQRTLEALVRNDLAAQTEVFVFSDGPRNAEDAQKVESVREAVGGITGFNTIKLLPSSSNRGLAKSIIDGVSEICGSHGRVIVVEDDLVTAPYFLRYMNEALDLYEADPEVVSIHGYLLPVAASLSETFFLRGADCWGWATWARGWGHFNPDGEKLLKELEERKLANEFDFNGGYAYTEMLKKQVAGEIDSWAIRWNASAFLAGKLTLYPGRSLVQNIGLDQSGQHCEETDEYRVELSRQPIEVKRIPLIENREARTAFERFFRRIGRRRSGWKRFRSLFAAGKSR